MKTRSFIACAVGAVAVVAACSDKTTAPDAGTPDAGTLDASAADTGLEAGPTSYGCDLVVDGGGHTCTDFVYTNIPMNLFETSKTQCTLIKGTLKAACDRTGAVGGCTMTEMKNGVTTVTTTWQYTGTVGDVMAICASKPGYTFVTP